LFCTKVLKNKKCILLDFPPFGSSTEPKKAWTVKDYANYLIALGYHKVNNTALAQKHILLARLQNPTNINYKILHAEIISKGKNPNEGVKIINEVKKESLKISSLKRSVLAQEQLILYNMNTLPELKDYHLGHYYYLGREFPKSLRVLQGIQTKKNKLKSDVFGLMSRIYFENGDYEKSETYAQRALKIDNKQANALMSMGDIRFREGRYKSALRSYKRGVKYDSNLINSQIKLINVYDKLDMSKKQRELVVKLLKGDNISSELYYQKSKVVESQNEDFLIKSLSLDIENKESWISLVDLMLAEGDYAKAERYLSYIRYIDENDFRYYYYQGQVLLKKGDKAEAERHFNKSKKLNTDVVILKENP